MKRLTPTRSLRTFTGLHDFGVIIAGLKLLHSMTDAAFFYIHRQVIGLARFSSHAKRLVLLPFFFVFGFAHALPSLSAKADGSTRAALVNRVVQNTPYEVRRADFRCPDLTAMMVPPQAGFGEQYVRCEDWDLFQAAMRTGNRKEAERLTFGPKE